MGFVGNLVLFTAVKEFCKLISNFQSYGTLFWLTVYFVHSTKHTWGIFCQITVYEHV